MALLPGWAADRLAVFFLKIDGHDMSIIEADGIEIEPYPIDVLTVAVAQRYSIIVNAVNTTNLNYAMMVMQSEDMYDAIPDDLVLNNTLQIVYDASAPDAAEFEVQPFPVLNDTEFVPVQQRAQLTPDIKYELNVFFDVSLFGLHTGGRADGCRRMTTGPTERRVCCASPSIALRPHADRTS
jgi:FtsP/CotA-like multicopper oxidase with cupredoxin domain